MVIVNPKLSLPTDLPYKKRQRPFNPNSNLHQATIRFNEALRKQYNDIQFAKRYENGVISQNELPSVNTVDIGKGVDPQLFTEMCDLNPLLTEAAGTSATRKRKSKKFFICSGSSISDAITAGCASLDHKPNALSPRSGNNSNVPIPMLLPVHNNNTDQNGIGSHSVNPAYDCNNTEMFPQLSATLPNGSTENDRSCFPRCNNTSNKQPPPAQPSPPSNTSSLEAQAINEYEPTADSAHDMIFGNVMGLHYGNYLHDHLWSPNQSPPQQVQNQVPMPNPLHANDAAAMQCQFSPPPQNYQSTQEYQHAGLAPPPPPSLPAGQHPQQMCGMSKSVGFNLPPAPSSSGSGLGINASNNPNVYSSMNCSSSNGSILQSVSSSSVTAMATTQILYNQQAQSSSTARPSSRQRSTSVPRPRVIGARKETLKQAAIRCGIIKGNPTVPGIPRRSHCLLPLQLGPAQSDPSVSVVEILHPRALIPTCSSDVLVDDHCAPNLKNLAQAHMGDNYRTNCANNGTNQADEKSLKENISEEGNLLTQISSISDFRILEGALSCASF